MRMAFIIEPIKHKVYNKLIMNSITVIAFMMIIIIIVVVTVVVKILITQR